jgi:hypothetical protein
MQMRQISPMEASVLSTIAEDPRAYRARDLEHLLPHTRPFVRDTALLLLGEPATAVLAGKPGYYRDAVKATAESLLQWADENRKIQRSYFAQARA